MVAEKQLRIGVAFLESFQGIVMAFQEHAVGVGLHSGAEGQSVQALGITGRSFQSLSGQLGGPGYGILKAFHAAGIGGTGDAAEEALIVEKIIAGEDVLEEEFLEKITGSEGNVAEGLGGILLHPFLEHAARFGELLLV